MNVIMLLGAWYVASWIVALGIGRWLRWCDGGVTE